MKSLTQLAAASTEPVDAEFFLWCSGIYSAAAHLSMPVENPASRPIFADGDKTYAFSDIPLNRGMLAVMKELTERGSSEDEKMAMCSRLMHFGEVFGAHKELEPFLKKGDKGDEVLVSEALIKACATARMLLIGDKLRFDIKDVARIAQELTGEDERTK